MSLVLTSGECNVMPGFDVVLAQVAVEHALENAIMDKGYDSNDIRDTLKEDGMKPVIPPKRNRKDTLDYDKTTYKLRE